MLLPFSPNSNNILTLILKKEVNTILSKGYEVETKTKYLFICLVSCSWKTRKYGYEEYMCMDFYRITTGKDREKQ